MARSRSRAAKPRRDWVYTTNGYAPDNISLQNGSASSVAVPLCFSQNARRQIAFGPQSTEPVWLDQAQYQSGAAFPETARQRIYAVDGCIICQAQDWALATFFRLGIRLLHEDMDNPTGLMSAEAGYSMWEETTPDSLNQWANTGYLREWYKAETWQGGTGGLVTRTAYVYPIRWRSRQGIRIGNNRALFLYLETAVNSRGLDIWTRLRTQIGTD